METVNNELYVGGMSYGQVTILYMVSSPAQTGLCRGEKEVGGHVSESGPRETEQLYTLQIAVYVLGCIVALFPGLRPDFNLQPWRKSGFSTWLRDKIWTEARERGYIVGAYQSPPLIVKLLVEGTVPCCDCCCVLTLDVLKLTLVVKLRVPLSPIGCHCCHWQYTMACM